MRMMVRLREERGASAVIVAILLVVLLGMLSLSVDGGFLFLKYRAIRTANDSAALAAALSCAKGEGQGIADGQATTLATDNVSDAEAVDPPVYTPSCNRVGGWVRVHFRGQQSLFFSQVVGVSSPKTVSAFATAAWGAAGGASGVAPLMLNKNGVTTCGIPDNVSVGDECVFWWDDSYLGDSSWGLMNLNTEETNETKKGWDVLPTDQCQAAGEQSYGSWLLNGFPAPLVLRDPPPTYVCRDPGSYGGALDNDIWGAIKTKRPFAFPVNDPSQQVDRDGNPCPSQTCTPDKYAVVGFGWLQLLALCKKNGKNINCNVALGDESNIPNYKASCAPNMTDSNSRCLVTVWKGYSTTGLNPGGGGSFGLVSVALTE